jgi:hypothetical protein
MIRISHCSVCMNLYRVYCYDCVIHVFLLNSVLDCSTASRAVHVSVCTCGGLTTFTLDFWCGHNNGVAN